MFNRRTIIHNFLSLKLQCNKNMRACAVQIIRFSKIEKPARVLSAYDSSNLIYLIYTRYSTTRCSRVLALYSFKRKVHN